MYVTIVIPFPPNPRRINIQSASEVNYIRVLQGSPEKKHPPPPSLSVGFLGYPVYNIGRKEVKRNVSQSGRRIAILRGHLWVCAECMFAKGWVAFLNHTVRYTLVGRFLDHLVWVDLSRFKALATYRGIFTIVIIFHLTVV